MRKFLKILSASLLVLSVTGCSMEAKLGGTAGSIDTSASPVTNDVISNATGQTDPTNLSDTTGPAPWPTDSWSTSSPEKQGVNSDLLAAADQKISDNYPNVYSLLVVRHGYLVYEKYYKGMDENDANPVYSVTKSVMSALTGIAKRDGLIENTDQKISEFMPEYFADIDEENKKNITIENVLTMTGGLESIDSDYDSYFMSPDWLTYTLEKPLTDMPGEKFVYNTGLTHFLSAIISEKSGMSTKDYADANLFGKIGISDYSWEYSSEGYYVGGFGINMKPADMAKFGFLYLHKGLWDGNQVLPENWVEESTQKKITADENRDYGYLFWLQTIRDTANNKDYYVYHADGYGGQYIAVIPDLDMVAVITADDRITSKDGANTFDIIADYVIPAAE